jgi:hypothetical protein
VYPTRAQLWLFYLATLGCLRHHSSCASLSSVRNVSRGFLSLHKNLTALPNCSSSASLIFLRRARNRSISSGWKLIVTGPIQGLFEGWLNLRKLATVQRLSMFIALATDRRSTSRATRTAELHQFTAFLTSLEEASACRKNHDVAGFRPHRPLLLCFSQRLCLRWIQSACRAARLPAHPLSCRDG